MATDISPATVGTVLTAVPQRLSRDVSNIAASFEIYIHMVSHRISLST